MTAELAHFVSGVHYAGNTHKKGQLLIIALVHKAKRTDDRDVKWLMDMYKMTTGWKEGLQIYIRNK